DPYINTLGGALAMAADAIWESPAYLHGAIAWRMHLNAWRGAYVADPLGWHDRAKTHFESYANSQVKEPESGPVVPDTTRNYARQLEKMGTSMFSSGYISRNPNRNDIAHHYDMNLVFIDQLVRHFKWTGDLDFLKKMWSVIKRHLAWEKRNYDVDGDGMYDAYAAIWASDGLGYSGGGVTYTSAYNYYANKMAAELAQIVGEDGTTYAKEAKHIHQAIQEKLWKNNKGTFAEYKDLLGNQLTHDTPGIWTVYHALDSEIADPFQAYQALKYVDNEIPHIPVVAEGLDKNNLELISTTNWQPYTWSVNNVALAEVLHTSLAYWQGGQSEKAYQLWESGLIESMYLGTSPGGFEQLLFQDAIRGELYRDFADPVGMAGRTLVEGLFGIQPDALKNTLTIKPGLPKSWDHASLEIPDVAFAFERKNNTDIYKITPHFPTKMNLQLRVNATHSTINKIVVNGKKIQWKMIDGTIGSPKISIENPYADSYKIEIVWSYETLEQLASISSIYEGENIRITTKNATILELKDTQNALKNALINNNEINAVANTIGNKSFFVKLKQKEMIWWQAIDINIKSNLEVVSNEIKGENVALIIKNNTKKAVNGFLISNQKTNKTKFILQANSENSIEIPLDQLVSGTNQVEMNFENGTSTTLNFINWDITSNAKTNWEMVKLDSIFNDKITNIFENKYLSPRAQSPSLQIPTQGIGNWCYPFIKPIIDDSGLRAKAGTNNQIISLQGIPFATTSDSDKNNIAFVSQWDNFPKTLSIPLSGKASQAYLMMAGTTNPMQSRFVNGEIIVTYSDGSTEKLDLKNPENWWPIEQDYYTDDYAFTTNAPKPPRIYLKTGTITRDFKNFKSIKGFSDFGVEGGAGTIIDIPLNKNKMLEKIEIKAIANEVLIGIMSLTLNRN
ncbi:MAG: GH116 family glycosyl hydrolase, partial [Flavobacterium sp.]